MLPEKSIDIKENDLLKIDPELLSILLKDKTTGNNIIWATDNYSKYGFSYSAEKEIKIELITFRHGGIIKPREVLSTPIVGSATTFLSVGKFNTQDEAEKCMKSIKTKFARAMLGTLKVTQDNPRETWLNVPLQDFTATSDIDWSKSILEIDKQLYKKYGLSADEVEFIESKVREM